MGTIHHIELNVSNLKKSVTFWGWFLEDLGYQAFQTWDEGRSWKRDETYIVFVQTKEKFLSGGYHRGHTGLNHLAFQASSKEQVDNLTKKLQEKGIEILYKKRHPFAGGEQHYAVFFEDPDRIKVELVAPFT
ncbi:VOC family protein [Carnobacterium sp. FSL W8-0810]|uniref:VOC family protein n=1 Tax=Carnobacterium sp. FSL W8-0810 TaxID=2954705 RepID=UPI0030F50AB0